jgi:hypothetical protein
MSIITVGWGKDYATISGAYAASSFGDTILIDEGVHSVSLDISNKIVNLVGKTDHPNLTGVILFPENDFGVICVEYSDFETNMYLENLSFYFGYSQTGIESKTQLIQSKGSSPSLNLIINKCNFSNSNVVLSAGENLITETASCSAGGGNAAGAINSGEMWAIYDSSLEEGWWKYDFGAGNEKAVNKVSVKQGWGGYYFYNYSIYVSNDDINWTKLVDVSVSMSAGSTETTTFNNSIKYRYLKLSHNIAGSIGIETLYAYDVSANIFECSPDSLKSLTVKNCDVSFYENGLCNSNLYEITDSSIIKTKLNRELYQPPFRNNFFNTSDVVVGDFFDYGSKYGRNIVDVTKDCTFSGSVRLNGTYVNRELRFFRSDNSAFVGSTTSSGDDGFYTMGVSNHVLHDIICLDDTAPPTFNDLIRSDCMPYTEGAIGAGGSDIPDDAILVYASDKNDLALLGFGLTARLVNTGVYLVEGSFKDCSFLFGYEDTVPSNLLEPLSRFFSNPTDVRCYKNTIYVGYAYRGTSHAASSTAHSELTWPWPNNISLYVYYKNTYWGSSFYPSNTVYDVTNDFYIYDNFDDGSNSTFIGITSYAANTAKVQADMNFGVATFCGLSYGTNVYPYVSGGEYGDTAVFTISYIDSI